MQLPSRQLSLLWSVDRNIPLPLRPLRQTTWPLGRGRRADGSAKLTGTSYQQQAVPARPGGPTGRAPSTVSNKPVEFIEGRG